MSALSVDTVEIAFSESAQTVLKVIAGVIFFSVALETTVEDLRRVLRRPGAMLLAVLAQFGVLPAITVLLTLVLDVRPSIALGMILVACCPPGKISNMLTLQASGDVALSVSMSLVSNLVAVLALPVVFPLWAGLNPDADRLLSGIEISTGSFFAEVLLIVVLPLVLGVLLASTKPAVAARFRPWLGRVGLGLLVALVVASLVVNLDVFADHIAAVFVLVLLHDAIAFALGYFIGWRMPEASRRAVTFEVGVRNAGLGLVLVFSFFDGLGGMALVVGWWSIWDIAAGLAVARWWARRPVKDRLSLDRV